METNQIQMLTETFEGHAQQTEIGSGSQRDIDDIMLTRYACYLIASCLTSLDDLIAAETQQLTTLKLHKRGLMQQLFPAAAEVGA